MSEEDIEEREKTKSWEAGQIFELERVAEDLRERAGDMYAHSDSYSENQKAQFVKKMAREYENEAEERHEEWRENYE